MTKTEMLLSELNRNQRLAVEHDCGPLFVVAGAGTGKTKTLTTRLAYLVHEKKIHPQNLLAITFTNKAAKEMRNRVAELVAPLPISGMEIYTFHAFGLRILKMHVEKLNNGLFAGFAVIDDNDSLKIIKEVVKGLNLDSARYGNRATRGIVSQIKTGQITTEDFNDEEFELITKRYNQTLLNDNLVDFDDLLIHSYHLLRDNEKVRNYYQNRFTHILIDEFQDTNRIQYELIKLLTNQERNVFAVGDPDQSIYSFRGADYRNTEDFVKHYGGKTIILDENYRSTQPILDIANKLIDNNSNRPIAKALQSATKKSGVPAIISQLSRDVEEVDAVLAEIRKLASQGYDYGDMAILYRANAISRIFEESLMRAQIDYVMYGGVSFFERREVKDVIAYIRVAINPTQNFYLKRIINYPRRGIGITTQTKIEDFASTHNISMFEAIDQMLLPPKARASLENFKNVIKTLEESLRKEEKFIEFIKKLLIETGYGEEIRSEGPQGRDRLENIYELSSIFTRGIYSYTGDIIQRLQQTLDEIALISDLDRVVDEEHSVKLATVHQAKGLEFKVVFVVALENGIFPNYNNLDDGNELEEERRVLYVAMTRAKELLYLSYATSRYRFGSLSYHEPSVFLKEILPKQNYSEQKTSNKRVNQTTITLEVYQVNDKVVHTIFGEGVIVAVERQIVTVAFKIPHGIQRIMSDHPALKKV